MKRAFTLIELLVVIAIIGILAGLLLPALQIARQKHKDLKAQSEQSIPLEKGAIVQPNTASVPLDKLREDYYLEKNLEIDGVTVYSSIINSHRVFIAISTNKNINVQIAVP